MSLPLRYLVNYLGYKNIVGHDCNDIIKNIVSHFSIIDLRYSKFRYHEYSLQM